MLKHAFYIENFCVTSFSKSVISKFLLLFFIKLCKTSIFLFLSKYFLKVLYLFDILYGEGILSLTLIFLLQINYNTTLHNIQLFLPNL